jgi:hypothetical protein
MKTLKNILSIPFFLLSYVILAIGIILLDIAYLIKDFKIVKLFLKEFLTKMNS